MVVAEHAVLDHLGVAGPHLAVRQGFQHRKIGQHQPWLMEGADQVLAAGGVDGGLAADRRIYLGQQGGGDLHEIDAALVDRRREPGQVADHAAAEGHDQVAAVELQRQQTVRQFLELGFDLEVAEGVGLALVHREGDVEVATVWR